MANGTPRRFHWRRLLQFRLRTVLIFVAILAAILGPWSYRAKQQRDAVTALRKAGATVHYMSFTPWVADAYPAFLKGWFDVWPRWLLESGGRDFVTYPCAVDFDNVPTDAAIEELQKLPSLNVVWVYSTDGDISQLQQPLPGKIEKRTKVTPPTGAPASDLSKMLDDLDFRVPPIPREGE